jgi:hypothetical protein
MGVALGKLKREDIRRTRMKDAESAVQADFQRGMSGRQADLSDARLDIQRDNNERAREQMEWQREDRNRERKREGFGQFIYGAFSGSDKQSNIERFNGTGRMQISDYQVNPDKSISITNPSGETAVISPDVVRGALNRFGGVDFRRSAKPGKYESGGMLQDFSEVYDITNISSKKTKAIEDGLIRGVPMPEIAASLGLELRTDTELFDAKRALENAEKKAQRPWKFSPGGRKITPEEQDAINAAAARVDEIESSFSNRTFDRDAQMGISMQDRVEGTVQSKRPITDRSQYDSNGDGEVNELDEDYKKAKRISDMVKQFPQARRDLEERLGPRKLAEAEALVRAVEQKAKKDAQQRVENTGIRMGI